MDLKEWQQFHVRKRIYTRTNNGSSPLATLRALDPVSGKLLLTKRLILYRPADTELLFAGSGVGALLYWVELPLASLG